MATGWGETTVDFSTGLDRVTVPVARATVTVNTHVEAYLYPKSTGAGLADHSIDEHLVDPPAVYAHSIVAGVGFSISAVSPPAGRSPRVGPDWLTGKYNVRWVATE